MSVKLRRKSSKFQTPLRELELQISSVVVEVLMENSDSDLFFTTLYCIVS
jgi:hypothetical protein